MPVANYLPSEKKIPDSVGLSLSGGGFRVRNSAQAYDRFLGVGRQHIEWISCHSLIEPAKEWHCRFRQRGKQTCAPVLLFGHPALDRA